MHTLQDLWFMHLYGGRMIGLFYVELYDKVPGFLQEDQVVKVLQTECIFSIVINIGVTNVLLGKVKVVVSEFKVKIRL